MSLWSPTSHSITAACSFVAQYEWHFFASAILLNTINFNCGVISSGAKQKSLAQVCGVNIGTGIDEEGCPASGDFNSEHVS